MTRHRILLLLGCITMGAFFNIAVAWTYAIRNDSQGISFQTAATPISDDQSRSIWQRYVPSTAYGSAGIGLKLQAPGLVEYVVYPLEENLAAVNGSPNVACEWHFGWPFPTLKTGAHSAQLDNFHDAWILQFEWNRLGIQRGQRLPTGLVWSGILLNTAFYGGICWLIARGPAETRRRWRELRGNCGRCGHLRNASATCTECGADLTRAWGSKPESHTVATPGKAGG